MYPKQQGDTHALWCGSLWTVVVDGWKFEVDVSFVELLYCELWLWLVTPKRMSLTPNDAREKNLYDIILCSRARASGGGRTTDMVKLLVHTRRMIRVKQGGSEWAVTRRSSCSWTYKMTSRSMLSGITGFKAIPIQPFSGHKMTLFLRDHVGVELWLPHSLKTITLSTIRNPTCDIWHLLPFHTTVHCRNYPWNGNV
jgi:hypothetical protein